MTYYRYIILLFLFITYNSASAIDSHCQRLVSLSPSVTESLYFLGLDKNLIAVSEYDHYPPEVLNKPKVGALFGTNLEALLNFNPTSVILLTEQADTKAQLSQLQIPTLSIEHRSISGILTALEQINNYCGVVDGQILLTKLHFDYQNWLHKTGQLNRPTVLILLAAANTDSIQQSAYVLGRDGFYQDIIYAAGGQTAYTGMTRLMPDVSMEGILAMQPDIIFILTSTTKTNNLLAQQISQLIPATPAVKNKRIYTFNDEVLLIPGPRFLQIIEKFYNTIHNQHSK